MEIGIVIAPLLAFMSAGLTPKNCGKIPTMLV